MFDQLLQAYPEVHPEDFVTFGVLQEQPRRGSAREWGEVAGVLANMVGGRQTLVAKMSIIINRIARLDRADHMRATEELALVAVIMRERRRSRVPLGEGAFDLLAAPGGPMTRRPPAGAPRDPRRRPASPPQGRRQGPGPAPGPSGAQGGPRPPPGFETVDLMTDDGDNMDTAPATPPPTVSDDEMETDEEEDLLASPGHHSSSDSDSDNGFQHV